MNTDQNYTPGPWSNESGEIIGKDYIAKVYDHSNPQCAPQYADINAVLRGRHMANASLIAAAPELFEALADMMKELDYLDATSTEQAVLARARTILARINGKATP